MMEGSQGEKGKMALAKTSEERKGMTETGDQSSVFVMFDKLDDEAIVAEIQSRIVEKCVYHFSPKGGGPEVWGLGKKGVDMAITEMAKKGIAVRDDDITYVIDPTDPEFVLFKAKARKLAVNTRGAEAELDAAIGLKRQWTRMKLKDDRIVTDPFWFEKGGQKAIRNARLRLISEDITAAIIAFAKGAGRVKEISEQEVNDEARAAKKPAGTISRPGADQSQGALPRPVTEKQVGFYNQLYSGLIKRGYDKAIIEEDLALYLQKEMGVDVSGRKIPGQLNTKEASKAIDYLKGLLAQEEGQGGPGPDEEPPEEAYGI